MTPVTSTHLGCGHPSAETMFRLPRPLAYPSGGPETPSVPCTRSAFTRTSIFAFYVALRSLSVFGSSVTSVSSLPHEQSRQVCESLHKLVQMRAWMQNALRKVTKKRKQVWKRGLCYAAENKWAGTQETGGLSSSACELSWG